MTRRNKTLSRRPASHAARILANPQTAQTDDACLQGLVWDAAAPAELRTAAAAGAEAFISAWRQLPRVQLAAGLTGPRSIGHEDPANYIRHLAADLPVRTRKLLRALQTPQPDIGLAAHPAKSRKPSASRTETASTTLAPRLALPALDSALSRWCKSLPREPLTPRETIVLEAWLPRLASLLSAPQALRLWRCLLQSAQALLAADDAAHDPLADELAFTTGLLFAPLAKMDALRRQGQQRLNQRLMRSTDRAGLPRAAWLPRLSLELEPLIRATHTAFRFQADLWTEPAARRFHALVEQLPRLIDARGKPALQGAAAADLRDQLDVARLLTTATGPHSAIAKILPHDERRNGQAGSRSRSRSGSAPATRAAARPAQGKSKGRVQKTPRPDPAIYSAASQLACLRCDWNDDSDRLTVVWNEPRVQFELAVGGRPLLTGSWDMQVLADGQPVALPTEWDSVCWNSDSEGDYLELQSNCDGLRVERQLFLSRGENFALLADSISVPGAKRLEYRAALPVAASVQTRPEQTTRELRLCRPRPIARIFPLALPEARTTSTPGSFAAGPDGQPRLQQVIGGDALFAPLVIDWEPSRQRSAADWRTLTVTEYGDVVRPDRAAGHRLRVGEQQLLIYRSLTPEPEIRAVLGHHTRYETVIGAFPATGEVRQILAIE